MFCYKAVLLAVLSVAFFGLAPRSDAASLTLAWDPSTGAAGYIVVWGTTSGTYASQLAVGPVTQASVSGLADGTRYFFAVQAYSSAGLLSDPSIEVNAATPAPAGTTISTTAPFLGFGGDGKPSMVMQSDGGALQAWFLNGWTTARAQNLSPSSIDPAWRAVGAADFDNDGSPDLLFQNVTTGELVLWYMKGTIRVSEISLTPNVLPDLNWKVAGIGDFDADGKPDILFQHGTYGILLTWFMDGSVMKSTSYTVPSGPADPQWQVAGIADMNADGAGDILFQHDSTGEITIWFMNGTTQSSHSSPTPGGTNARWRLVDVADVNGDGQSDLIFQRASPATVLIWFMNGLTRTDRQVVSPTPSTGWTVAAVK